ncbi:hypothetical protein ACFL1H_05470 [Nanoarchaeota archaeon]
MSEASFGDTIEKNFTSAGKKIFGAIGKVLNVGVTVAEEILKDVGVHDTVKNNYDKGKKLIIRNIDGIVGTIDEKIGLIKSDFEDYICVDGKVNTENFFGYINELGKSYGGSFVNGLLLMYKDGVDPVSFSILKYIATEEERETDFGLVGNMTMNQIFLKKDVEMVKVYLDVCQDKIPKNIPYKNHLYKYVVGHMCMSNDEYQKILQSDLHANPL